MSKPIINNRVIYNNLLGRVAQHDLFLNQGVTTGDSPTFDDIFILGDASITGNLYVEGNTTILNNNIVEFEDNIILINRLETGSGVTLNQSGLEIERGTLENYRIIFNESDDTFRVGPVSNTQAVATREDLPLINGVMVWNDINKRLDSTNTITVNLSLTSTTNSTSSSTGALNISGGLGVNKDIYTTGKLYLRGTNNSNNSVVWTDTSNSFNITSPSGINISPTTNISIPYDKPINIGNTNTKLIVDSTSGNLEISSNNDIKFTLDFGKRISVPNSIPITFSTQNEKIYADSSNNMVLESSQDVNIVPGVNKTVFLNFDTPLSFGNSKQKIYSTLIENIYIESGNDIFLSPSSSRNIILPSDTGIKLGNDLIYSDSSSKLLIQSVNDINISVTSNNIVITGPTKMNFGNTNQYIWGETTTGSLNLNGHVIKIESTTESTNSDSGGLVVKGGVGISKNLNVDGNTIISGDLTVLGITTTLNTETVVLEDNLLVVNSGPSPLADGGFLVKKFQSGTTGTVDYAGLFYKQSDNRFVFANTLSDPGKTNITIDNYLSLTALSLVLSSTQNATGLATGGLSINGGASINKDLYVGGDIVLPNATNIVLSNTNGNSCNITIQDSSPGVLQINSDSSIKLSSSNGSFSFWNNNKSVFDINTSGSLLLSGTENAIGLGSGGNLTVSGGCSVNKDFYIGGRGIIYDTTVSTNGTSASLVVFGGLSVGCNTNSTYGNGGALTVSGGAYIEKDLYISENLYSKTLLLSSTQSGYSLVSNSGILILDSTNAESLTEGGSLLSYGGASINKDVYIGGDLYLSGTSTITDSLNLSGGFLFQTITNGSSSNLWNYLGSISSGHCNFSVIEKQQQKDVILSINDTTPSFTYSKYGDLEVQNQTHVSIYKNGGDYHIFLYIPENSDINLLVKQKSGNKIVPVNEGNSLEPNGVESGYTNSWTEFWTTKNEPSINYSVGDLTVEGQLNIYDNVPLIGYQNTNSNKILSRDLGIAFQRYQESNDTNIGDVITDSERYTDIIPSQSTANTYQVVFSNSANLNNDYYVNWWIKTSDNQVRKITSYNGPLRVAQVDKEWVNQPQEGDTILFYNTQLPSLYWDESDKHFSLSFIKKDNTVVNNGNIGLKCQDLLLTGTEPSVNGSTGNIYSLGGISISNSTNAVDCSNGGTFTTLGGAAVQRNLFVGDKLYIGFNATTPSDSLTIQQTTGSITILNTVGSYSSLLFAGDGINKKYALVNDNSSNLFSITYSSGTETPNDSSKSLVINSDGNVGLKTTENINSLLTLKGGNFISCDSDSNYLGFSGSTKNSSGSRIVMNGDLSSETGDLNIYAGGTAGNIKLYSSAIERVKIDNSGVVKILTTNDSVNSSTGSIVCNGGLSIRSTTNATSFTNGGSFTTDGGLSVKKDVYIGGDVYIDGNINTNGGVDSPSITISNTSNCTIISIENSSLIKINNQVMYTVSVVLTPEVESEITEFQFGLPQRVTNFTKLNQSNIQCSGFTGDESTVFNITGTVVPDTTNCKIRFQSASTGVHYIQILCRYSI